jgi:hypothetical protein
MDYLRIFDTRFEKKKENIINGFKRAVKKREEVNYSKSKIDLLIFIISKVYGVPESILRDNRKTAKYPDISAIYIDGANGMFYFFLNKKLRFSIDDMCRMYHASNSYVSRCMGEASNSTNKETKDRFNYLNEKIESIEF